MQWCFVSEIKLRYCVLFRKPAVRAVADAVLACRYSCILCSGYFIKSGCIPPLRIIPAQKFFQIRMHSSFKKHPYSKKFVTRDYFPEANASLFERIRRQGLFSRGECIPIQKNSPPGIIFPRRMHPYSENFVARDYCSMENASLTSYFVESGCIPPSKCIPDRVFLQIRMHSSGK